MEKLTVLICGASGFIGSAISLALKEQYTVIHLPRDYQTLPESDAIINLAGSPIYHYWTQKTKEEIFNSRVNTTKRLVLEISKLKKRPSCFISASAIGYYGDRQEELLFDDSSIGEGFLPTVCKAWEEASLPLEDLGIRRVITRFGIVIGNGGILKQLMPLARLHLAGKIGNGMQWVSWIAIDDLVQIIAKCLQDRSMKGVYALTSLNPIRQKELSIEIARQIKAPKQLFAPSVIIRLTLGEMGKELLLSSAKVIPKRLQSLQYAYRYPDISSALQKALSELK